MKKLIVFGCSLSAVGHLKTWNVYVAHELCLALENFAVPASGNILQIKRFQEAIIDGKIDKDDIIVWQITSCARWHKRTPSSIFHRMGIIGNRNTFDGCTNIFDNKPRIDYLYHHKDMKKGVADQTDILQELLFHLMIAKKINKKILIIFGWDKIIPNKHILKFKDLLYKNKIDYIDQSLLNYAISNSLPITLDGMHLEESAYISFGKNKIIPKFKELGWI